MFTLQYECRWLKVDYGGPGGRASLQWLSRVTPVGVPPHSSRTCVNDPVPFSAYVRLVYKKMKLPLVSLRVAVSCYCSEMIQKLTVKLEWPYFPEHTARQT